MGEASSAPYNYSKGVVQSPRPKAVLAGCDTLRNTRQQGTFLALHCTSAETVIPLSSPHKAPIGQTIHSKYLVTVVALLPETP